ncbi:MAG TPA: tRNA (adenosine(37)-N6)-threonylcarbamoyltransferase complex dimerization subunit type 1 TsaB [Candidatus Paceibacterota bacterium]|nr:tRNA (adenosine(37)-N6)-threonylcarbamoyltransferase complex dimerization subunit type 1 TsaB [Candidatus Paceibacterota bacterium]
MTILALEFSSPQRSVALARGETVLSDAVETGGRNTAAFGMIEKVLAEAKTGREEIEVIVVGLGPGSYTGIRAAISIAQGWQLAAGVKLLGIGSVEAMAAQAQAENIFGRVNVVVDAQRNEFYLAAFEISAGGVKETGPLKILPLAEIQMRAAADEILTGPEVMKWFPKGRTIFPRAAVLARLAAGRTGFAAGEKLEPVYLRETNFVKSPPRGLIAAQ